MTKHIGWQWLVKLGFALVTALTTASVFASMGGIDHLADYESVSDFYVNGTGGFQAGDGNAGAPGPALPDKWHPGLTVHVKWDVSDWKDNSRSRRYEADVPVDPYTKPGTVYVHFLADGTVRVVVTNYYPGSPQYPGPHDPIPHKHPWNDYPQSWVDSRPLSERLKELDVPQQRHTPATTDAK